MKLTRLMIILALGFTFTHIGSAFADSCVAVAADGYKKVLGYTEFVEYADFMAQDQALKNCRIKAGSGGNCTLRGWACNQYIAVYGFESIGRPAWPDARFFRVGTGPTTAAAESAAFQACESLRKLRNLSTDTTCTRDIALAGLGKSIFEWYYGL